MIKIKFLETANIFEWTALRCPYCGGNSYLSLNLARVVCEGCDCNFTVHATSGGLIVLATPPETGLYAFEWTCHGCGETKITISDTPATCQNRKCSCFLEPLERKVIILDNPRELGLPDYFSLHLTETSCSGWYHLRTTDSFPIHAGFPSLQEWLDFRNKQHSNEHHNDQQPPTLSIKVESGRNKPVTIPITT